MYLMFKPGIVLEFVIQNSSVNITFQEQSFHEWLILQLCGSSKSQSASHGDDFSRLSSNGKLPSSPLFSVQRPVRVLSKCIRVNTLRWRQNGCHFAHENCCILVFWSKSCWIFIRGLNNNMPAKVQIMACCKNRWQAIIWNNNGFFYKSMYHLALIN